MAPNGDTVVGSYITTTTSTTRNKNFCKPPRLSMDGLKRTTSDISFELSKESAAAIIDQHQNGVKLPPISEVENAKCECCGMSEECTPQYIQRVRDKFSGKWICGLCSEAVKEELEKNGGKKEEALTSHMNACVKFNSLGRAYPALYQAEAVREILKKSPRLDGRIGRANSYGPRERGDIKDGKVIHKGGIMRTASCIPAITKEMNETNDRKKVTEQ
ncbi:hypothetical protein MKW94_024774 [Papaver nudicaule]|uniref:DUF1677 family protein n=1 Tax=Papaver nudicaule TaxID=74823 RepID=A0AA41VPM7_PAPNU|nr:hypothetical protein [Papaver nudicaule]